MTDDDLTEAVLAVVAARIDETRGGRVWGTRHNYDNLIDSYLSEGGIPLTTGLERGIIEEAFARLGGAFSPPNPCRESCRRLFLSNAGKRRSAK